MYFVIQSTLLYNNKTKGMKNENINFNQTVRILILA